MIDVRRCTVAELEAAPNFYEVLDEYARESAMPELGRPNPQIETYRMLELSGMFHPIGAFRKRMDPYGDPGDSIEMLVGFILPIVVAPPHYGVVAATVESFFVPVAERKKGLGLWLLDFAEVMTRGLGAKALLLSAPVGGMLTEVLQRHKGYRHSNNVFVRALV